jgi:tRNA A-37 threonylcarbamoyl transferase component Bud32
MANVPETLPSAAPGGIPPPPAPPPSHPTLNRFCIFGGTGAQLTGQLHGLLRGRLQLVALITLFPVAIFLVRNILHPHPDSLFASMAVALQLLSFVVNFALAAVLWSRFDFSLRTLRLIELSIFGTFALYFGWMQFDYAYHDLLNVATDNGTKSDALRLLSFGLSVRWFFLIICYGVFIPNTWRRCALVVGCTALLPLLISAATALGMRRLDGDVVTTLFDMEVVLVTACIIAVFGSYRIHALQEQAFEAQQLGQYRLKGKLATGGMGDVYLAEHTLLRRPCAVKLIRPDQAGDPQTLQRFEREVRAMATLTHWNTVEIFDYGHADDGTFYYVMEYLPGVSLEALVARHGPLPPERAVHFLRQVCRALREAHAVGLLHRDVKPSNIIACERGGVFDVAKLLDFGLVQGGLGAAPEKVTLQGAIVGSPPYMSPEQALGKKEVDARSDIYGVGAVAYFLLTGQPPFPRETVMQMLLAHAYEPPLPVSKLRPDVPADLEAVVMRCLQKQPDDRYPDVATLEKALAACGVAELWTEERAAAWWQERPGATGEAVEVGQPTVVTAR